MGFTHLYPEAMAKRRKDIHGFYASKGKQLSAAELELMCFKHTPFGHPLLGEFCISVARMRWDFLYVEKDGIENYWFTRMMRVLCTHRKNYFCGSASAGKTFAVSVWLMNMWGASPSNTTALVTSTTKESLDSKIWGTIQDLHEKDKFKIGERINSEDAIVLQGKSKQRDIRDAIKAKALPKGAEGKKAIGEIQGRKNDRIIWARDEYDHMDSFVAEAEGNLSSVPQYHCVSNSNKPDEGGPMWHGAMPNPEEFPLGWDTPDLSDLEGWRTANGAYCSYFDGEKSPNMLSPKEDGPFERLTRKSWVNEIRKEGDESLTWWTYVKSFPKAGMSVDRLITAKVLERYEADKAPVWAGSSWIWVAGLDPSWTKGGDDCVADFGRVGIDFRGLKILAHEASTVKLNLKTSHSGTVEEQVSKAFLDECVKRDCHVVAIDISGSGGRVANAVREECTKRNYKLEIIVVDAAGSPDENETYLVGDKRLKARDCFDRRVSELWYAYRMDVEAGFVRGCVVTSQAIKEMSDRRVSQDDKKRFQLEDKKEYKKRNKGKSPDNAEARILLRYAAHKHGLGANVINKSEIPKTFKEAMQKEAGTQRYGWEDKRKAYNY